MSDTPRTDALEAEMQKLSYSAPNNYCIELCQQLERELNAALSPVSLSTRVLTQSGERTKYQKTFKAQAMTFDQKCEVLAVKMLSDCEIEPEKLPQLAKELAQNLQRTIEQFIDEKELH